MPRVAQSHRQNHSFFYSLLTDDGRSFDSKARRPAGVRSCLANERTHDSENKQALCHSAGGFERFEPFVRKSLFRGISGGRDFGRSATTEGFTHFQECAGVESPTPQFDAASKRCHARRQFRIRCKHIAIDSFGVSALFGFSVPDTSTTSQMVGTLRETQ